MRSRRQQFPLTRSQAVVSHDSAVATRARNAFIAGALGILTIAAQSWAREPFPRPFNPALPYQYTASSDPRLWLFLQQVSPCIERGAEFTIVAPSLEEEHELYVFSVGAIPHAKPLPAAYFGFRQGDLVSRARFVAVFDSAPAPAGTRGTCRTPFGIVYERATP